MALNEFIISLILAFIQGFSEWFPISSSGHLVVFSHLLKFENSVAFDVALHFGTLMAVFVYFGRDITTMAEDILRGKWQTGHAKLGGLLVISAIPAAVIGFSFRRWFELSFESLLIVGIGFGITGIFLLIASLDIFSQVRKMPRIKDAWIIGFAQVVSIFPGISRSGSTIASGLLTGLDKEMALKLCFLMSIPV